MIGKKIKKLRKTSGITQADLARELGITRSSVNAWEMGVSLPSTLFVIELARIFNVSTDYLLDVEREAVLDISGLDDDSIKILTEMVYYMRNRQD